MGLVVVPGGSGGISIFAPTPITSTIFHNCCSREQTGQINTCRYKLYYATVLLYNILPEEGAGVSGDVVVTFSLRGEPLQLDCFSGPLVLEPGQNMTLCVSITFDEILFTFLPPPPTSTTFANTEMLYRISLGMCPA